MTSDDAHADPPISVLFVENSMSFVTSVICVVWNVMRQTAAERFERGELPSWFNPHWLAQEEAPVNALLREMGDGESMCTLLLLGRATKLEQQQQQQQQQQQGTSVAWL